MQSLYAIMQGARRSFTVLYVEAIDRLSGTSRMAFGSDAIVETMK